MRPTALLYVVHLMSFATQGCAANEVPAAAAQSQATQEITTEMPALPSPDLVIDSRQAQREATITVNLNQVIAIVPPSEPAQWRITYAESVVELLTSKEVLEDSERKEWLLRARAVGSTDIRLTSITPACTDPLPCPQAPPQVLTFTLEVK